MNRPPLVVPLEEAGEHAVRVVGSKARSLGDLAARALPVPPGVVLTTAAVREADDGDEPTPHALRALREALEALGEGPWAVRSSATEEDLSDASFAGQYETFLGVESWEEVRDAVLRCHDSASAERVRRYRATRSQDRTPEEGRGEGMAVVVQRLVPAEAAGVAFTADPVSGRRDRTVINAVWGLGERLVSGEATPDEWVVDGEGEPRSLSRPEGAISSAEAAEVAALARRVEALRDGAPQDVEWALAGGVVHLLQARPVTALPGAEPVPVEVEVPEEGFWFRDEAHFPRPFHPLFASCYIPLYEEAVGQAFREFGLLPEGVRIREIGGWPYARVVPPMEKDGPPPPAPLLWLAARLHPAMRRKMRRARRAVREGLEQAYLDCWWNEWRQELDEAVRALDRVDLEDLSRQELLRHLDEALDVFGRGLRIHFRLFPPFFLAVADLVFFCEDELGWQKDRAMSLLAGLSETSSEPGRALSALAERLRDDPATAHAVRMILREASDARALHRRLEEEAPEFAEAFRRHQDRYGLRVVTYDFGEPSFRERPAFVLGCVLGQLERGYDPDEMTSRTRRLREATAADARDALQGRPGALARFDSILERAARAYPVREDNEFVALCALGAVRTAVLEAGRRMAERGHLDEADDAFFLTRTELTEWLTSPRDRRETASRRRGQRAWTLAHPSPATYGDDPGAPPDPSLLPPAAARANRALLWTVENDIDTPRGGPGEGIQGVGASGGRYTGPVRIVRGEAEFDRVRPGDVLVCPITSPTWSVLFPCVGALVTDAGGLLSHPAIIAREHGIPAVVATGDATTRLTDGETVTVDGDAGTVERVDGG